MTRRAEAFVVFVGIALGLSCLVEAGGARAADDLIGAYRKELAFLDAEKRALEERMGQIEALSQENISQAKDEIEALQRKILAMRSGADEIELELQEVERENQGASEREDLLLETLDRAFDSLRNYGHEMPKVAETPEEQAAQIRMVFETAAAQMERNRGIRIKEGDFFTEDGSHVKGKLVQVGNIATYGISSKGAGALAPAGAGRLKLWKAADASGSARALLEGHRPVSLVVFLYESLDKGIEEKIEKTWYEVVSSGGPIGWIIVGLGAVGLLLILVRLVILSQASSSTTKIVQRVSVLLNEALKDEAYEYCRKKRNPASRVLAATIRNLDRDREHLEDIVSEAILHESPYIERFGSTIMVIAAVAPLLGLLGTVTGMISTFDIITEFGTGDPKLLSSGISVALVTTELGLIVAIPTLLIGTLLSGRASGILQSMERSALKIMNLAQDPEMKRRMRRGGSSAAMLERQREQRETESKKAPAGAKIAHEAR